MLIYLLFFVPLYFSQQSPQPASGMCIINVVLTVIIVQEETSFEARRKHNLAQNELLKSMIGLVCLWIIF